VLLKEEEQARNIIKKHPKTLKKSIEKLKRNVKKRIILDNL